MIRSRRPYLIAFIAIQIALGQIFAGSLFGGSLRGIVNFAAIAEPEQSPSGSRILREKATGFPSEIKRVKAAPLDGGIGFLNSDKPITLKSLAGKFVVLDFWTFCCINCMHILPKLAELEEQYGDRLTVVGIHSAKFENEKDTSNISKAIERYGIKHPVLNDANFKIWDAYGVQAWPTLVLIDPEGYVIGVYSGEGHTSEIAALIDKLSPWYSAQGSLKINRAELSQDKSDNEQLSFPGKIALSPDMKQLVISDTGHNRIVVANLEDDQKWAVETVIGSGESKLRDGSLTRACFNHPQGVCIDGESWNKGKHIIDVADTGNNAVRRIDLDDHSVITRWGTGKQAAAGASGGKSGKIELNSPWDLTITTEQDFVAMAGSHQVWHGAANFPAGVWAYAGSGRENLKDGSFEQSAFAQPSGITYSRLTENRISKPFLFIADAEDSGIRQVDLTAKQVSTLIGKGLFIFGDVDGPIADARLQHPLGICADGEKLYIADSYNHKIKCLELKTKTIATIAGSGKSGYKDGEQAQFAEPGGLAFANGKIYVADTNNSVIRVITLAKEAGGANITETLKLIWKH